MRVSAPPFLNPCYYGTDIDSQENLIACCHSSEEIARVIGVDTLGYLPVSALRQLTGSPFCCDACFTAHLIQPVFLSRSNEGSANVLVLNQSNAIGDAGGPAVSQCGVQVWERSSSGTWSREKFWFFKMERSPPAGNTAVNTRARPAGRWSHPPVRLACLPRSPPRR